MTSPSAPYLVAVLAFRVAANHLNVQGICHGGMLTTMADSALGMNLSLARGCT